MLKDRLKEQRKIKKITQEKIAEKLNIKRSTYAKYETGENDPDTDTLQKLADFFNVTTDYLLGRNELVNQYISINKDKELNEKDEKDIAKRMAKIREDLKNGEGLSFSGEPMSEEAIESLLEAIEYAERQTKRINKKYIPKKYREED